jgi:uncharacterized membrane protein YqgA involved in biofilm formation
MEPMQPLETPTPTLDTDAVPVEAPVSVAAEVAPAAPVAAGVSVEEARAPFESLYDAPTTAVIAIILGACIVGGIQYGVQRLFASAKSESSALTSFATSMCAIIVAVYACDMLVAGPHAELLSEQERVLTLGFIKDMTMLVFAYYFGTQSGKA